MSPNINEAFPSKYLQASDLGEAEPTVTMSHVDFELVGQTKEKKAVLYFHNKEKGLVLNKTNADKIMELTGSPMTEEWDGERIRLYATETQFQGKTVPCIRIKAASKSVMSRMTKKDPEPAPIETMAVPDDDEIPF